ncbi:deaminase domain-containing protein [Cohnella sp. GCM10027633]|uniref:deaminase domain-containing protein n=1 Tax=unclassified Cohnella TaxID=2636738 RepID=UPI00363198DC
MDAGGDRNAQQKLTEIIEQGHRDKLFEHPDGEYWLIAFTTKNLAYLEYTVDKTREGFPLSDHLMAHSKLSRHDHPLKGLLIVKHGEDKPFENNLKAGYTRNINLQYPEKFRVKIPPINRNNDTEVTFLEELSRRFTAETTGDVHLYTTLEPCISCDFVIINFLNLFRNISLNIYFHEKCSDCEDYS